MARFRIGVMAGSLKERTPEATVAAARKVGAECLQVSDRRPVKLSIQHWADAWLKAVGEAKGGRIAIASAVTGFPQENYSSIEAIHRTGGLLPDELAEANVQRVIDAADFAAGARRGPADVSRGVHPG